MVATLAKLSARNVAAVFQQVFNIEKSKISENMDR